MNKSLFIEEISTNELCYTSKTSYGNAIRFTQDQAMVKLIKLGYTKKRRQTPVNPRKTFRKMDRLSLPAVF